MELETLAERAAQKGGVRLYGRNVARVLQALLETEDFWQVVDRAALPVPGAAAIVEVLMAEGLVERRGDDLVLTGKGKAWIEVLGLKPLPRHACPA